MASGTADERRLTDLCAANDRREQALHAKRKCTCASVMTLRTTVFMEMLLDHFGLTIEAALRVEELRERSYDEIEREARVAALTDGSTNGGLHVAP